MNLFNIYTEKIDQSTAKEKLLTGKVITFSFLRLIYFIALTALFIYFVQTFWQLSILTLVIGIFVFKKMIDFHDTLKFDLKYNENIVKINKAELEALNGDFSSFKKGTEHFRDGHFYELDLDIFGNNSVFQSLNRTVTVGGERKLVNALSQPCLDQQVIYQNQEAIKELAPEINLRQKFQALGSIATDLENERDSVLKWIKSKPILFFSSKWKLILTILPLLFFTSFILNFFDIIRPIYPVVIFIIQLVISSSYLKVINGFHADIDKKYKWIKKNIDLLKLLENQNFKSEKLKIISSTLKEHKSTKKIEDLSKLLSFLDYRLNLFVYVIFNGTFLMELNTIYRISDWINKNADLFEKWIDAVEEFDYYSSLANYACNNQDFTFPTIDTAVSVEAKNLSNYLLPKETRIGNDFSIPNTAYFSIITGANMSGKSTYLRTVGTSLLLAMMGLPVAASEFKFTPQLIFTSMRTTDSLADGESYFYAELKRLKQVVDFLKNGTSIFIILDEILKGTNSEDKRNGSMALLRKLVNLNATGIIATHDLVLGQLETEIPGKFKNFCFDAHIHSDELTFDFKLKPGICSIMNAMFLMKKMELVEDAYYLPIE